MQEPFWIVQKIILQLLKELLAELNLKKRKKKKEEENPRVGGVTKRLKNSDTVEMFSEDSSVAEDLGNNNCSTVAIIITMNVNNEAADKSSNISFRRNVKGIVLQRLREIQVILKKTS
ncbi:hypothetical protein K0M31_005179 [Melipona bicolor]|uniref:Uncharacterized protein n=1 Tax=Melipona bicolor TaxID=60889 RepID=A0AA40FVH0_9HYME|nr:hypothetical protein K0M31_005179 [Melipona bicolor]